MRWILDVVNRRKEKSHANAIKKAKQDANMIFQIKEYNSHMWLTCNGELVAPFTLLLMNDEYVDECISLVNSIRELYVERITNDEI
jgi:hypothetical protein